MEGVLALIAVAGVTYMIVWMRRHSRGLKGVLEENAAPPWWPAHPWR